jgi:hypothetical protein
MRFRAFFAVAIAMAALALVPSLAYAAGVTADVTAGVRGTYTGVNALGTVTYSFNQSALAQFAPGTALGKADKLFSDQRTIAASGTLNLDLAGTLTDPFGTTLTCVKVKTIFFVADAGNTNNVVVGGAGSNTFVGPFADATDKVAIPPGGSLLLTHPGAGWTVTAATGDILLVANSGGTTGVTFKVIVVCTSA